MLDFTEDNNEIVEVKDKDEELAEELGLLEDDGENYANIESTGASNGNSFSSFKIKRRGKAIGHETVRTYLFSTSNSTIKTIKKDYNKPFIIDVLEKRIAPLIEETEFPEDEATAVQELIDSDKLINISEVTDKINTSKIFTDDLFTTLYSQYINYLFKEEKDVTFDVFKLKEQKEINKIIGDEFKSLEKGLYNCKKCGSYNVKMESKQTRSSDEPETLFIDCKQCGHRQRFG